MPNIGPLELLLLGVLLVVLFGPAKLPEIGRGIGRATRDFKDAIAGTGIDDAIKGVSDVRGAMSPTNLAKAAMPTSVKEMASDVTDMKETFKDPLGMNAETKDKDETSEAGAKPAAAAAPASAEPVAVAATNPARTPPTDEA
jgi:TatA/E family protein of Tat protein translocase